MQANKYTAVYIQCRSISHLTEGINLKDANIPPEPFCKVFQGLAAKDQTVASSIPYREYGDFLSLQLICKGKTPRRHP